MSGSPGADDAKTAYDAVADDYAAFFRSTEPEQRIDLAGIDHMVDQLRYQSGPPLVLDAGCGAGRMSQYLTERGCRVLGVDLSPRMIDMCRRDHPGMDARVASIADLPFEDSTFAAALYWYSIIHMPDDALTEVFAEARRVVQPGGLALFAFQTGAGVRDVAGGYRRLGHEVTLMRYHRSPDDVSRLLQVAGLQERLRMVRSAMAGEQDGQAVLLVQRALLRPEADG
ncbi:MAG: methyltransferase domain-containing protein [Ornithinimicrobium sp.]